MKKIIDKIQEFIDFFTKTEFYIKNEVLIKKGLKYVLCIIFITFVAKNLIKYPVYIAYKYNIKLSGADFVNLYSNYNFMFIGTLLLAILAIPGVRLVNRLKKISKDGPEFYEYDEKQISEVTSDYKKEISNEIIIDLIKSNDECICDEKNETDMFNSILNQQNEEMNLLKCRNIKNHMKPLTIIITRELFNNRKNDITSEYVAELVKKNTKRKRKKFEERNKEITKNIIAFLKNNDIIESDDVEDEKYYFTQLGNIFMNYFSSGII